MEVRAAESTFFRVWPTEPALPQLRIRSDVLETIESDVGAGVGALPRRGLEVGGLLTGSYSTDEIVVEGLEPIESEYPEGPCYRVAEELIEYSLQRPRTGSNVVGFYRSRTDGKLDIDAQDDMFLRVLGGSQPLAVFLVRQSAHTPAEARVGFHSNGSLQWSDSVLPLVWLLAPDAHSISTKEPLRTASRPPGKNVVLAILSVGLCLAVLAGWQTLAGRSEKGTSIDRAARLQIGPGQLQTDAPVASSDAARSDSVVEEPKPRTVRSESEVARARSSSAGATRVRSFRLPPAAPVRTMSPRAALLVPEPPAVSAPVGTAGPPVLLPPSASLPPAATEFVPPVLSRQPTPVVVPPELRRLLQHEVVITVRVSVDERGRVLSVVPVRRLDRTEQVFVRSYVAAIQSWQFEPARRNGQPSRGEAILNFRLSPSSR